MSGKEKNKKSIKSRKSSGKHSNKSRDSDEGKKQRIRPDCFAEYNDCISMLQK